MDKLVLSKLLSLQGQHSLLLVLLYLVDGVGCRMDRRLSHATRELSWRAAVAVGVLKEWMRSRA